MSRERPPAASGNEWKDHFSGHAAEYAAARPRYPSALFAALARCCRRRQRAWDCATGNGQAALALAEHFDEVLATDASETQVAAASAHPRVRYRVATAEQPGIDAESLDLITVAQALHWFDINRFFAAAARCLRPGGALAYWCYGFCSIEPECDRVAQSIYAGLDDHWPPERAIVERGYRDIEPPFAALSLPAFEMTVRWSVEDMLAYIRTWSACQRAARATGADPLETAGDRLRASWGPGLRLVRWPIYLTACRKPVASS